MTLTTRPTALIHMTVRVTPRPVKKPLKTATSAVGNADQQIASKYCCSRSRMAGECPIMVKISDDTNKNPRKRRPPPILQYMACQTADPIFMLARAEVLRDERRNITGCLLEQCHRRQKTPITAIAAPSASVDQAQGRCGQWSAANSRSYWRR